MHNLLTQINIKECTIHAAVQVVGQHLSRSSELSRLTPVQTFLLFSKFHLVHVIIAAAIRA